jgi:N-acetylneuraminate lyase
MKSISGLVAATFTPMHADGTLNLDTVPAIVERMVQYKLGGLYVNGSTGEGPLLTTDERKAAAEAYVSAADGRIPVIVQVGHASNWEARGLAAHAASIGADAVSALPPIYFKPDSVNTLVACLKEIASGAPDLPFYYYHIPTVTNVSLDMRALLRAVPDHVPTFAGVKFSSHLLDEFQACIDLADGRYQMLLGVDDLCVTGHALGASGAVGTTYSFMAPIFQQGMAAYDAGNTKEAFALQIAAGRILKPILEHKGMAGLKAMMKLLGLDCGPSRLPLHTLSDAECASLRVALEKVDYFEKWAMV